ncbi:hypothetical protein GCM10009827_012990 [Dactylosporangium maewongense]|uniref:Secreted protein n=1 Tax=Dactylosporangium maewongense TaxID=634393 RepID=A0ABN1ZPY0_9ACTN
MRRQGSWQPLLWLLLALSVVGYTVHPVVLLPERAHAVTELVATAGDCASSNPSGAAQASERPIADHSSARTVAPPAVDAGTARCHELTPPAVGTRPPGSAGPRSAVDRALLQVWLR